jgi:non-ribosomal peptide synthetase component E (peptide arylation enzyme)
MLEGVTPFPPEFAARYRAAGYWQERPLYDGFRDCLRTYADRVAIIDDNGPVTYRQLEQRSARLARALLGLGLGPLDRIVVQLPNSAIFAYLYFALQRIGAIPVLALPGHRKREITQFAEIAEAKTLAVPAQSRGFDYTAMGRLGLDELTAFLRGLEIATFKLPERLELVDRLPLSGFGKVSKKDLTARLSRADAS